MASETDALGRARQLARSQCSNEEIAAILIDETGAPAEKIDAYVAEIADQLQRQRLAGQGFVRDYVFRAATPAESTAASLQLASWVSRQLLGFTTNGVQGDIDEERKKLEGMTNEELSREHIRQAAELYGVTDLDPVEVERVLRDLRAGGQKAENA